MIQFIQYSLIVSIRNGSISTSSFLWAATQPGGSLFGLQFSNPVNPRAAYQGSARRFGTVWDPMRGRRVGGVNVFGGGLALYDADGHLVGAIGVSGDTSCADHNVAWRTRDALGLDHVPAGLSTPNDPADPNHADNIIYDLDDEGKSAGGFGHPTCLATEDSVNADIMNEHPIGE